MDPRDFYTIAEYLFGNFPHTKEEAAFRTAISRAYYAAFLYARQMMQGWGCRFHDSLVHSQVSEGLLYSRDRGLAKVGRKLRRLHEERKKADYEVGQSAAFDRERIEELYGEVVPRLAEQWGWLSPQTKERAKENIKGKVSQISSEHGFLA